MENQTKPQAPALTLKEFFSETYAVPPYQRFFAWGVEEIEQLFTDLQEFATSDDPYYFMGQVIVAGSSSKEKYDLVDGQQRATALLILLVAVREKFEQHPDKDTDQTLKVWLSELNLLLVWSAGGNYISPRVKAAGDGSELLSALINKTDLPEITGWTRENILNAYEELLKRLEMYYANPIQIPNFYRRIVDGVILVRLEIQSHEEAIGIFERINNRGLALSSADLIKNTIFSKVDNDDYANISDKWEKGADLLHSSRVTRIRPMSYLLRAVLAGETGALATNKALRDRWSDRLKDRSTALEFANSLPQHAENLKRVSEGICPSDKSMKDLSEGSKYFRFIQHFPILLAASHINPKSYEYLSRLVEDRSILSVLAAERPQDFEKLVPGWSNSVHKLGKSCSISEIFVASNDYVKDITNLLDRAEANFRTWRYTNQSERKRIRYVLARLNREIQLQLKEPNVPALYDYLKRPSAGGKKKHGYDLDHIRPQSKHGKKDLTHAIGNLAFVSESDQRAAGDKEPIEKSEIYGHSGMALTQSLVKKPAVKKKRLEVIEEIWELAPPALSDWSNATIDKLAQMYWNRLKTSLSRGLSEPS
jgi:hypothetical protein